MVASVSEKLRWRLGTLEVSAFSRMVCNELDFRRFDWWDPMSHGGSGRLKDRRVSNTTSPLESSWSCVSADTVDLNKQWRACIKIKQALNESALINLSTKLWFTWINTGIIHSALHETDAIWRVICNFKGTNLVGSMGPIHLQCTWLSSNLQHSPAGSNLLSSGISHMRPFVLCQDTGLGATVGKMLQRQRWLHGGLKFIICYVRTI